MKSAEKGAEKLVRNIHRAVRKVEETVDRQGLRLMVWSLAQVKLKAFSLKGIQFGSDLTLARVGKLKEVLTHFGAKRENRLTLRRSFLRWMVRSNPFFVKECVDRLALTTTLKKEIAVWRMKKMVEVALTVQDKKFHEFSQKFFSVLHRAQAREVLSRKNFFLFALGVIKEKDVRQEWASKTKKMVSLVNNLMGQRTKQLIQDNRQFNPSKTLSTRLVGSYNSKLNHFISHMRFGNKKKNFAKGYKFFYCITNMYARKAEGIIKGQLGCGPSLKLGSIFFHRIESNQRRALNSLRTFSREKKNRLEQRHVYFGKLERLLQVHDQHCFFSAIKRNALSLRFNEGVFQNCLKVLRRSNKEVISASLRKLRSNSFETAKTSKIRMLFWLEKNQRQKLREAVRVLAGRKQKEEQSVKSGLVRQVVSRLKRNYEFKLRLSLERLSTLAGIEVQYEEWESANSRKRYLFNKMQTSMLNLKSIAMERLFRNCEYRRSVIENCFGLLSGKSNKKLSYAFFTLLIETLNMEKKRQPGQVRILMILDRMAKDRKRRVFNSLRNKQETAQTFLSKMDAFFSKMQKKQKYQGFNGVQRKAGQNRADRITRENQDSLVRRVFTKLLREWDREQGRSMRRLRRANLVQKGAEKVLLKGLKKGIRGKVKESLDKLRTENLLERLYEEDLDMAGKLNRGGDKLNQVLLRTLRQYWSRVDRPRRMMGSGRKIGMMLEGKMKGEALSQSMRRLRENREQAMFEEMTEESLHMKGNLMNIQTQVLPKYQDQAFRKNFAGLQRILKGNETLGFEKIRSRGEDKMRAMKIMMKALSTSSKNRMAGAVTDLQTNVYIMEEQDKLDGLICRNSSEVERKLATLGQRRGMEAIKKESARNQKLQSVFEKCFARHWKVDSAFEALKMNETIRKFLNEKQSRDILKNHLTGKLQKLFEKKQLSNQRTLLRSLKKQIFKEKILKKLFEGATRKLKGESLENLRKFNLRGRLEGDISQLKEKLRAFYVKKMCSAQESKLRGGFFGLRLNNQSESTRQISERFIREIASKRREKSINDLKYLSMKTKEDVLVQKSTRGGLAILMDLETRRKEGSLGRLKQFQRDKGLAERTLLRIMRTMTAQLKRDALTMLLNINRVDVWEGMIRNEKLQTFVNIIELKLLKRFSLLNEVKKYAYERKMAMDLMSKYDQVIKENMLRALDRLRSQGKGSGIKGKKDFKENMTRLFVTKLNRLESGSKAAVLFRLRTFNNLANRKVRNLVLNLNRTNRALKLDVLGALRLFKNDQNQLENDQMLLPKLLKNRLVLQKQNALARLADFNREGEEAEWRKGQLVKKLVNRLTGGRQLALDRLSRNADLSKNQELQRNILMGNVLGKLDDKHQSMQGRAFEKIVDSRKTSQREMGLGDSQKIGRSPGRESRMRQSVQRKRNHLGVNVALRNMLGKFDVKYGSKLKEAFYKLSCSSKHEFEGKMGDGFELVLNKKTLGPRPAGNNQGQTALTQFIVDKNGNRVPINVVGGPLDIAENRSFYIDNEGRKVILPGNISGGNKQVYVDEQGNTVLVNTGDPNGQVPQRIVIDGSGGKVRVSTISNPANSNIQYYVDENGNRVPVGTTGEKVPGQSVVVDENGRVVIGNPGSQGQGIQFYVDEHGNKLPIDTLNQTGSPSTRKISHIVDENGNVVPFEAFIENDQGRGSEKQIKFIIDDQGNKIPILQSERGQFGGSSAVQYYVDERGMQIPLSTVIDQNDPSPTQKEELMFVDQNGKKERVSGLLDGENRDESIRFFVDDEGNQLPIEDLQEYLEKDRVTKLLDKDGNEIELFQEKKTKISFVDDGKGNQIPLVSGGIGSIVKPETVITDKNGNKILVSNVAYSNVETPLVYVDQNGQPVDTSKVVKSKENGKSNVVIDGEGNEVPVFPLQNLNNKASSILYGIDENGQQIPVLVNEKNEIIPIQIGDVNNGGSRTVGNKDSGLNIGDYSGAGIHTLNKKNDGIRNVNDQNDWVETSGNKNDENQKVDENTGGISTSGNKNDGTDILGNKNDGIYGIGNENDGIHTIGNKNDGTHTMGNKNEGIYTIDNKNDGNQNINDNNDGIQTIINKNGRTSEIVFGIDNQGNRIPMSLISDVNTGQSYLISQVKEGEDFPEKEGKDPQAGGDSSKKGQESKLILAEGEGQSKVPFQTFRNLNEGASEVIFGVDEHGNKIPIDVTDRDMVLVTDAEGNTTGVTVLANPTNQKESLIMGVDENGEKVLINSTADPLGGGKVIFFLDENGDRVPCTQEDMEGLKDSESGSVFTDKNGQKQPLSVLLNPDNQHDEIKFFIDKDGNQQPIDNLKESLGNRDVVSLIDKDGNEIPIEKSGIDVASRDLYVLDDYGNLVKINAIEDPQVVPKYYEDAEGNRISVIIADQHSPSDIGSSNLVDPQGGQGGSNGFVGTDGTGSIPDQGVFSKKKGGQSNLQTNQFVDTQGGDDKARNEHFINTQGGQSNVQMRDFLNPEGGQSLTDPNTFIDNKGGQSNIQNQDFADSQGGHGTVDTNEFTRKKGGQSNIQTNDFIDNKEGNNSTNQNTLFDTKGGQSNLQTQDFVNPEGGQSSTNPNTFVNTQGGQSNIHTQDLINQGGKSLGDPNAFANIQRGQSNLHTNDFTDNKGGQSGVQTNEFGKNIGGHSDIQTNDFTDTKGRDSNIDQNVFGDKKGGQSNIRTNDLIDTQGVENPNHGNVLFSTKGGHSNVQMNDLTDTKGGDSNVQTHDFTKKRGGQSNLATNEFANTKGGDNSFNPNTFVNTQGGHSNIQTNDFIHGRPEDSNAGTNKWINTQGGQSNMEMNSLIDTQQAGGTNPQSGLTDPNGQRIDPKSGDSVKTPEQQFSKRSSVLIDPQGQKIPLQVISNPQSAQSNLIFGVDDQGKVVSISGVSDPNQKQGQIVAVVDSQGNPIPIDNLANLNTGGNQTVSGNDPEPAESNMRESEILYGVDPNGNSIPIATIKNFQKSASKVIYAEDEQGGQFPLTILQNPNTGASTLIFGVDEHSKKVPLSQSNGAHSQIVSVVDQNGEDIPISDLVDPKKTQDSNLTGTDQNGNTLKITTHLIPDTENIQMLYAVDSFGNMLPVTKNVNLNGRSSQIIFGVNEQGETIPIATIDTPEDPQTQVIIDPRDSGSQVPLLNIQKLNSRQSKILFGDQNPSFSKSLPYINQEHPNLFHSQTSPANPSNKNLEPNQVLNQMKGFLDKDGNFQPIENLQNFLEQGNVSQLVDKHDNMVPLQNLHAGSELGYNSEGFIVIGRPSDYLNLKGDLVDFSNKNADQPENKPIPLGDNHVLLDGEVFKIAETGDPNSGTVYQKAGQFEMDNGLTVSNGEVYQTVDPDEVDDLIDNLNTLSRGHATGDQLSQKDASVQVSTPFLRKFGGKVYMELTNEVLDRDVMKFIEDNCQPGEIHKVVINKQEVPVTVDENGKIFRIGTDVDLPNGYFLKDGELKKKAEDQDLGNGLLVKNGRLVQEDQDFIDRKLGGGSQDQFMSRTSQIIDEMTGFGEGELSQIEQKNKDLKEKTQKDREEMDRLSKVSKGISDKNEKLDKERKNLLLAQKVFGTNIANLKDDLGLINEQKEKEEEKLKKKEEESELLESRLDGTRGRIKKMEGEKRDLENEKEDLEAKKEDVQEKKDAAENSIENNQNLVKEVGQNLEKVESEEQQMRKEKGDLKGEKGEIEDQKDQLGREKKTLERQVLRLNQKLDEMGRELKKVDSELKDNERKKQRLEKDLGELESEKARKNEQTRQLNQDLEDKYQEIKKMNEAYQQKGLEINDIIDENTDLLEKSEDLKEAKEEMEAEIYELKKGLREMGDPEKKTREFQGRMDLVNKKLDEARAELNTILNEIDLVKDEIEDQQKKFPELDQEIKDMSRLANQKLDESNLLFDQAGALEREAEQKRKEGDEEGAKKAEDEARAKKEEAEKLVREAEDLENSVYKKKKDLEEIGKELEKMGDLKKTIEERKQKFEGIVDDKERELEDLEKEFEDWKIGYNEKVDELNEKMEEVEGLNGELGEVKKLLQKNEIRMKKLEGDRDVLIKDIEKEKLDIAQKCKEVEDLRKETKKLEDKIEEGEAKIEDLQTEAADLKQRKEKVDDQKKEAEKEKEEVEQKKGEVEQRENEVEDKLESVEKRMRNIEKGLEDARQQRSELHMKIGDLKKDIERKQNQLEVLKTKGAALDKRKERINEKEGELDQKIRNEGDRLISLEISLEKTEDEINNRKRKLGELDEEAGKKEEKIFENQLKKNNAAKNLIMNENELQKNFNLLSKNKQIEAKLKGQIGENESDILDNQDILNRAEGIRASLLYQDKYLKDMHTQTVISESERELGIRERLLRLGGFSEDQWRAIEDPENRQKLTILSKINANAAEKIENRGGISERDLDQLDELNQRETRDASSTTDLGSVKGLVEEGELSKRELEISDLKNKNSRLNQLIDLKQSEKEVAVKSLRNYLRDKLSNLILLRFTAAKYRALQKLRNNKHSQKQSEIGRKLFLTSIKSKVYNKTVKKTVKRDIGTRREKGLLKLRGLFDRRKSSHYHYFKLMLHLRLMRLSLNALFKWKLDNLNLQNSGEYQDMILKKKLVDALEKVARRKQVEAFKKVEMKAREQRLVAMIKKLSTVVGRAGNQYYLTKQRALNKWFRNRNVNGWHDRILRRMVDKSTENQETALMKMFLFRRNRGGKGHVRDAFGVTRKMKNKAVKLQKILKKIGMIPVCRAFQRILAGARKMQPHFPDPRVIKAEARDTKAFQSKPSQISISYNEMDFAVNDNYARHGSFGNQSINSRIENSQQGFNEKLMASHSLSFLHTHTLNNVKLDNITEQNRQIAEKLDKNDIFFVAKNGAFKLLVKTLTSVIGREKKGYFVLLNELSGKTVMKKSRSRSRDPKKMNSLNMFIQENEKVRGELRKKTIEIREMEDALNQKVQTITQFKRHFMRKHFSAIEAIFDKYKEMDTLRTFYQLKR